MGIKQAVKTDAPILAELAAQLWEGHTPAELEREFEELLSDKNAACFLCYDQGEPVGFAQCQLRHDYVEGTESSPVGYLEGIFVREDTRRQGFAKALLRECQRWAKEKGCREFASDCELDNRESFLFHLAAGFEEANRIICFRKEL